MGHAAVAGGGGLGGKEFGGGREKTGYLGLVGGEGGVEGQGRTRAVEVWWSRSRSSCSLSKEKNERSTVLGFKMGIFFLGVRNFFLVGSIFKSNGDQRDLSRNGGKLQQ